MKSFQILSLLSMLATAMAFAPSAHQAVRTVSNSVNLASTTSLSLAPTEAASIISSLPTQTLSLEVQFGAYLAVLLGTFFPVLFLINLYVQTESRKAGRAGGQDSE